MRNFFFWFGVFARGFLMGAADLIPGVSGGTVAFVSGIYERLIAALRSFTAPPFWRALVRFDWRGVFAACDAGFLLALAAGIAAAVGTLAGALKHLLENHLPPLLAFFAALVVACAVSIWRKIRVHKPSLPFVAVVFGAATLWLVGIEAAPPGEFPRAAIFPAAAAAICAMILPGISGSYLLLIMGAYPLVIDALHERDFSFLLIFAAGCGAGLLAFARVLHFVLRRWHDLAVAALCGVMLGALPKLWPWKETGDGDAPPILRANIWPTEDARAWETAFWFAVGLAAVAVTELLAARRALATQAAQRSAQ